MAFEFTKATRSAARLRAALIGPAGSGKTYSALAIGMHLGARMAVIDTEHGSASKYAPKEGEKADPSKGTFDFEKLELTSFAPATYIEAIGAAEQAGFEVIIVDSLSHAWMGAGGALEMVDKAAKRSNSANSFNAWRDVTPHHNALVEKMLQCRAHLIVTMRAKTEYVLETNERGKQVPRKVGLAPVQRDGLEYEFDVVGMLNDQNDFVVSKTRCSALADGVFHRPGRDIASALMDWLGKGPIADKPVAAQPLEQFESHPVDIDALPSIQSIRNDLDQLGEGLSIEQLVAVYCDNEVALNTDHQGDARIVEAAQDMLLKRSATPLSKHAFNTAVTVQKSCDQFPAFKALIDDTRLCLTTDHVVEAWMLHSPEIQKLRDDTRKLAFDTTARRAVSLDESIGKNHIQWLINSVNRTKAARAAVAAIDATFAATAAVAKELTGT